MALVTIRDVSIRFRGPQLLDDVSCLIHPNQRIGLLGRNGAGKTTFMRMLAGELEPDHGDILMAPETRVARLPQDVPLDIAGPVEQVVAGGIAEFATAGPEDRWRYQQQVEQTLSRMSLDGAAAFERHSSGMKRRVLLARALASKPDVLLLDEPTNHLDIESIEWLEQFLLRLDATLLFVTHDRVFLQKLATRILELDRGKLFDWECDYATFVQRKEAALAAEEKQQAEFDKKLAREETWIRQGIKARRTRNEGRVRALQQLRRQRQDRQAKVGSARMQLQEAQRSGNLVVDVDDVSFAYDQQLVVRDLTTTILRGDKVGIIGPNGAGKTTLLRILLGRLKPDTGSVRLGTNLQVAYFDQLREQLDPEKTVQDNVADGADTVVINGGRRHVIGYLQDFLFEPERARSLVKHLSGGERNRLLLARLLAKPSNVLVLDEPTNDLDTETLELLEQLIVDYPGTVLLVSHDRAFLNNVVGSTLVFEGGGTVKEYVGGYDDWLRQRAPDMPAAAPAKKTGGNNSKANAAGKPQPRTTAKPRKLNYREQQELKLLPERIEQMESELEQLTSAMSHPDFYQQSGSEIAEATARLEALQEQVAEAYGRWEELEALA